MANGKVGRPKKDKKDIVKNQLIAVDYSDYLKIKQISIDENQQIKEVFHEMLTRLFLI